MLEAQNLECRRGDARLFAGLSFALAEGELLHLRGANGSGKTSLLRILCGLLAPVEGEVRWRGENIRAVRDEFNQDLLYIGHLNGIKDELTAVENLRIWCQFAGADASEERVLQALGQMGLRGREELPTKVLSQGQKRRVALAKLLLGRAKLWILDEPFTALDVKAVALLQSVLAKHLEARGMVMLTTHQDVEITSGQHRHLTLDSTWKN